MNSSATLLFASHWPIAEWTKFAFFNKDFLQAIQPFWLQFPPPAPSSYYILAILYTAIMLIGVIGNAFVIVMFIRRRSLRTSANLLVMNLAVSDFFMLAKIPIFIFNCIHLGPVLGQIGCSLYGFLGGLTGTVSIATLAAIALDRYNVIVHPLGRKTTRRRIYTSIILIWTYGTFFAVLPLLNIGFNRYAPEGYLASCSFDYLDSRTSSRVMIAVFFIAAWVVPFCIIATSYLGICRAVLKARQCGNMSASRHCKEEEKWRTELRLAGVVIGVVALWFLSWTPYAVVALLGISGYHEYISPLASMVPALFCKTASCIDPFVYAVTHPRFRMELQTMLHRRRLQRSMEQSWAANTVVRRDSVEEMMVMISSSKIERDRETEGDEDEKRTGEQGGAEGGDVRYAGMKREAVRPPSWFRSPFRTSSRTKRSTSLKIPKQLSMSSM